jgi:DNA-binding winged helix-turn-helix (wHTH) protein
METKVQHSPLLEVHGPDDQSFVFVMNKEHITVGRYASNNDIGLEPDPNGWVSRSHCVLEHQGDTWWVADMKSHNKTLIRRNGAQGVINEPVPLAHGDTILILSRIAEDGQRLYWELTFTDPSDTSNPDSTHTAPGGPVTTYLEYDWLQAKLFRVLNGKRQEICGMRPKERLLICYMMERNNTQDGLAVMCSYDDLIAALWEDEPLHQNNEISRLVHELRGRIEIDPRHPHFLETVSGLGYRLVMRPPTWLPDSEETNGQEVDQDQGNGDAR